MALGLSLKDFILEFLVVSCIFLVFLAFVVSSIVGVSFDDWIIPSLLKNFWTHNNRNKFSLHSSLWIWSFNSTWWLFEWCVVLHVALLWMKYMIINQVLAWRLESSGLSLNWLSLFLWSRFDHHWCCHSSFEFDPTTTSSSVNLFGHL